MKIKEIANIDNSFYEIDKKNMNAKVELRFSTPSDIFDDTYMAKAPVLSGDFMDCIENAFRRI